MHLTGITDDRAAGRPATPSDRELFQHIETNLHTPWGELLSTTAAIRTILISGAR